MVIKLAENKSSESISEYAYRTIRKNIIDLNLKPGEAITENEVANALNVSRTPIRDAFSKLVREDLLEIYPQRGTFVSLINMKHIKEAQFLRINVEVPVMKLACENFNDNILFQLEANLVQQQFCIDRENYAVNIDLDNKMHYLIFKGCEMDRLWEIIRSMSGDLDRTRTLNLISVFDWDEVLKQHKRIVDAIKDKDIKNGEKMMHEHLMKVIKDQTILKEKYSQYFK